MGRGTNPVADSLRPRGSASGVAERYRAEVATQAPRVASLGVWPPHIDPQASLTGRIPTATATATGFDAGIACALDLIPREHQQLAASLHAAYTPAAIAQVRAEVVALEADSPTGWWLAACSLCVEGELTPAEFVQQVADFTVLARDPKQRLEAARNLPGYEPIFLGRGRGCLRDRGRCDAGEGVAERPGDGDGWVGERG